MLGRSANIFYVRFVVCAGKFVSVVVVTHPFYVLKTDTFHTRKDIQLNPSPNQGYYCHFSIEIRKTPRVLLELNYVHRGGIYIVIPRGLHERYLNSSRTSIPVCTLPPLGIIECNRFQSGYLLPGELLLFHSSNEVHSRSS